MAVSAFGRALSYTGSVLAIETAGHVPCATARLDLRQAHCVEQCLPWLQATSLAAGFARQLCPKWQRTKSGTCLESAWFPSPRNSTACASAGGLRDNRARSCS